MTHAYPLDCSDALALLWMATATATGYSHWLLAMDGEHAVVGSGSAVMVSSGIVDSSWQQSSSGWYSSYGTALAIAAVVQ